MVGNHHLGSIFSAFVFYLISCLSDTSFWKIFFEAFRESQILIIQPDNILQSLGSTLKIVTAASRNEHPSCCHASRRHVVVGQNRAQSVGIDWFRKRNGLTQSLIH